VTCYRLRRKAPWPESAFWKIGRFFVSHEICELEEATKETIKEIILSYDKDMKHTVVNCTQLPPKQDVLRVEVQLENAEYLTFILDIVRRKVMYVLPSA
jgi:hypothetical protein